MSGIDRAKFAAVAEEFYKSVIYSECDCIGFVKHCAKQAGLAFSSSGTNNTWRSGLISKGLTNTFSVRVGDVVFRYHEKGSSGWALPRKYENDICQWDVYHIGIVTEVSGNKYVVCHSSGHKDNGRRDVYNTKTALAKYWPLCGILRGTNEPTGDSSRVQITNNTYKDTTVYVSDAKKYPKAPFVATTKVDKLNLRKNAGTKYPRLEYIPIGTKLTITDTTNSDWGLTTYNGKKGYVMLSDKYMSW